jgi:hypothetical protein
LNDKEIMILKVHQKLVTRRLQLAPGDSIVSVVATKSRHTSYTPQIPLSIPKVDPENIIKKGKTSQEWISTIVLGDSGNLQTSSLKL